MCRQADGEPWLNFAWRQLCERPFAFVAAVCLAGVCYVYHDFRDLVESQTKTNAMMVQELREMNTRVSHLEREHEALRTKERKAQQ